ENRGAICHSDKPWVDGAGGSLRRGDIAAGNSAESSEISLDSLFLRCFCCASCSAVLSAIAADKFPLNSSSTLSNNKP
ncbi:MAG: hypothetical protein ACRCYN_01310, partial [Plesiomonas sp.]